MHKVEPYPQEFEHRDVWLPGAPTSPRACAVPCVPPASWSLSCMLNI